MPDEPMFFDPGRKQLIDDAIARRAGAFKDTAFIHPWRRPCTVTVLLVTDGALDFGEGDFGLSTFVRTLINDSRSYVQFELTLAHLSPSVSDVQVMAGASGIARSIKGFAFDNASHFASDMYDEVWLFGFETNFNRSFYSNRQGNALYPPDRLGDAELLRLAEHMNRGGGLFATGDHGALGKALCGAVDRAKSMRYWQSWFPSPLEPDEVSMTGERRNDTNAIGHDPGSQFSDQSDDIPQQLDLKLYTTYAGLLRDAQYPHPVLCSPLGRINVFPDHPHEGECRDNADLTQACADGTPEYPTTAAGTQVKPEVVAWGHVQAGNDAIVSNTPTKYRTQAHTFGVVSAYDGHPANVGRVICDSTWHHFVNVNLIGILEGDSFDDFSGTPGTHPSKHDGFLSSPSGQAHLAKIRHYYVNIGVWIAPPDRMSCMQSRIWLDVIWAGRVVEATLDDPDLSPAEIPLHHLYHIGIHARDVLGRTAGQCQSLQWIIPIFELEWQEIAPWINPWQKPTEIEPQTPPPIPWFDPAPAIFIALGGAVAELRHEFPYPVDDLKDAEHSQHETVARGAKMAIRRAQASLQAGVRSVAELTKEDEGSEQR